VNNINLSTGRGFQMASVYAVTGRYALTEEHGKQLADIAPPEGFDFAKVEIFCSNFWTGFFW
jgi:hypothetical protein